jgi:UDP-N-acetylmuramoyl-tripeptide--D-alanyl-D-alanine ligase
MEYSMTLWTKEELLEALGSQILESNFIGNIEVDEVVIDSRKITNSGLFIAIKGDINNGHEFIGQAATNGCKLAIISEAVDTKISTILVKNTLIALSKLAEFSRQRSQAKIIGITGSVGKTGTKEMLKSAFKTQGKTFATVGNFNNHIGAPLSLSNFARDCDFGIFEMGMNHPGEIEPLSKLIRPHLAIITNVGPVHIEFFKDEEEIALAKSEIFAGLNADGIILLNADNSHFSFLKKRANSYNIPEEKQISFAEKNSANYQILSSRLLDIARSEIAIKLKNNKEISYEIASSNPAVIFNSAVIIACLDLIGNDLAKGVFAFKNLETASGRGKIHQITLGEKNITIIDDSYNASLTSMQAGLTHAINLKNLLHKNRVIAALGDMLELGDKSDQIHSQALQFAEEIKIDFAILVGEKMKKAAENLAANSYSYFENSLMAEKEMNNILADGDILYLKGSRGIKMENLIKNLITNSSVH